MTNKVIIAGDWHGRTLWGKAVIQAAVKHGIDTIYHVGDFGYIGRGGDWYINELAEFCEDHGVKIWVTPGNHEDWARLYTLWDGNFEEPADLTGHGTIYMLPPGFRWERAGVTFMSLGGAPSIDRNYRIHGVDWWPQECLTLGEAMRAIEGGPVDIMITHDAPDYPGKVHNIIYNGYNMAVQSWGQSVMEYCMQGHKLLNSVYERVTPKWLFHGHYHLWEHYHDKATGQHVVALDMEHKTHNAVILDLDEVREEVPGKPVKIKALGAYIK